MLHIKPTCSTLHSSPPHSTGASVKSCAGPSILAGTGTGGCSWGGRHDSMSSVKETHGHLLFCRTRYRCGLLYLKERHLLQQNWLCIPRTAGWWEVTSKYESTFCHQTAMAKLDFCDHEAATPLFIEIADIHMLFRTFVERCGHVFRWRGFWNLNRTSENIMPVCCQCNSNHCTKGGSLQPC